MVVLGTGWAGTTFLRNLDTSQYDVQVVSPRNYFVFTPLLPSVTCGTVEPRSIVEPIRKIMQKVLFQFQEQSDYAGFGVFEAVEAILTYCYTIASLLRNSVLS